MIVFRDHAGFLLHLSFKLKGHHLVKGSRNDRNQQVKHDYHVEDGASCEQNLGDEQELVAHVIEIEITQTHSIDIKNSLHSSRQKPGLIPFIILAALVICIRYNEIRVTTSKNSDRHDCKEGQDVNEHSLDEIDDISECRRESHKVKAAHPENKNREAKHAHKSVLEVYHVSQLLKVQN